MSLPHNGSTAPTITSPLLAWPSLPKARSPLTPPEADRDSGVFAQPAWKGKARETFSAPPDGRVKLQQAGQGEGRRKKYAPPKQPLSPHQLSRIAQSFGIVIPSLPLPPTPSPTASPHLNGTPSLSASPHAGPSRAKYETRTSPHLLTVIPPLSLLSLSSTSADEAERRTRKWKRGRLIPLQPTLGGMLVAIAREFGLPSTTGLQVYMRSRMPLGANRGLSESSSVTSLSSAMSYSQDDHSGPQISSATWSSLFAAYLNPSSSSRSTSPAHTPLKQPGELGRDIAFPLSPLSLLSASASSLPRADKPLKHARLKSLSSDPTSLSADTSSAPIKLSLNHLPPTPTSAPAGNPIIGTIEFDVDLDLARWVGEYHRSGGGRHRKYSAPASSGPEGGMRALRLPKKVQQDSPSPAQLRERNANLQHRLAGLGLGRGKSGRSLRSDDDDIGSGETTLNDHEEAEADILASGADYRFRSKLGNARGPSQAHLFPKLKHQTSTSKRLSVRRGHSGHGMSMRSTAGSLGHLDADAEEGDLFDASGGSGSEGEQPRGDIPSIYLHERIYSGTHSRDEQDPTVAAATAGIGGDDVETEEDLLASPITLDLLPPSPMTAEEAARRGSAMVMSDQLDHLEKLMRQLSPRDIRLTSPRMLTPRMAAKVAKAGAALQFPANPALSVSKSSLSSSITGTGPHTRPVLRSANSAPSAPSRTKTASGISTLSKQSFISSTSASSTSSHIRHLSHESEREGLYSSAKTSAERSTLTVNTFGPRAISSSSFDASTLTRPPLEEAYSEENLRRNGRIILPYNPDQPATPDSPIFVTLPNRSYTTGSLATKAAAPDLDGVADADADGEAAAAANLTAPASQFVDIDLVQSDVGSPDWRPRRPTRPASPKFRDPSILEHELAPELVDHLRSPERRFRPIGSSAPSNGESPSQPDFHPSPSTNGDGGLEDVRGKLPKSRSGSLTFKGLKSMGSKNFGRKNRPPALPLHGSPGGKSVSSGGSMAASKGKEEEAVGLFRDRVSPQTSTFPGLRSGASGYTLSSAAVSTGVAASATRTGEAASQEMDAGHAEPSHADPVTTASPASPALAQSSGTATATTALPSRKGSQGHAFSRWINNPFGTRKGSESPKPQPMDRTGSGHRSKRTPSIDQSPNLSLSFSKKIGSPIADTFHHTSPSLGGSSGGLPSARNGKPGGTGATFQPQLPSQMVAAEVVTISSDESLSFRLGDGQGDTTSPAKAAGGAGAGAGAGVGDGVGSPRSVKRKPVPMPAGSGAGGAQRENGSVSGRSEGLVEGEGTVLGGASRVAAGTGVGGRRNILGLGIKT